MIPPWLKRLRVLAVIPWARLLALVAILASLYLAVIFGYPFYQYAMMYLAFDDAVDGGIARVRFVHSQTETDVSDEVVEGVRVFLMKRATELHLPSDALEVQVRVWAGRLIVQVAWEAPVNLGYTTRVLNFSMKEERELLPTAFF